MRTRAIEAIIVFASCLAIPACDKAATISPEMDAALAAINETYVFADMHAHPSRFHRENVETILPEEIEIYRRNHMDLFVANISSDMAFSGTYVNRDGTEIAKGQYKPKPGEAFNLSVDRIMRLRKTAELGYAVLVAGPSDVQAARESGDIGILPALEGADALEGNIENLHEMYDLGLRLIQLVHYRNNELGHMQTWPYSPGGLTDFGRKVVEEANRFGIVIDLAHANTETIMDALELSTQPVIFSHGGVKAFTEHDRAVSDQEILAIAEKGGVIGIWPHGRHIETVALMVDYIEHVIEVGGIDHVGIGSDLRGVSRHSRGFDEDGNFRSIAAELLNRGHGKEAVGKIMGGNFFRVWQAVTQTVEAG